MATEKEGGVESQYGTVARLNRSAGFGYVLDASGEHNYIFVAGKALRHSEFSLLSVGMQVKFRVSGQGRVDELVVA